MIETFRFSDIWAKHYQITNGAGYSSVSIAEETE